jgi:hypothetical protein
VFIVSGELSWVCVFIVSGDRTIYTINTHTQDSSPDTINTLTQDSSPDTINTLTQDRSPDTINTLTQDIVSGDRTILCMCVFFSSKSSISQVIGHNKKYKRPENANLHLPCCQNLH